MVKKAINVTIKSTLRKALIDSIAPTKVPKFPPFWVGVGGWCSCGHWSINLTNVELGQTAALYAVFRKKHPLTFSFISP